MPEKDEENEQSPAKGNSGIDLSHFGLGGERAGSETPQEGERDKRRRPGDAESGIDLLQLAHDEQVEGQETGEEAGPDDSSAAPHQVDLAEEENAAGDTQTEAASAVAEEEPPSEQEEGGGKEKAEKRDVRRRRADLEPDQLKRVVEALLFISSEAVKPAAIARSIGARAGEIRKAIRELQKDYASKESALEVIEIAGGYRALTCAEVAPFIKRFRKARDYSRLSAAALDTLAIIAYKQPVLREDIEHIRGVGCLPILKTLMEKHLVIVVGRSDRLGSPLLYGTTPDFLDHFGLRSISELPRAKELKKKSEEMLSAAREKASSEAEAPAAAGAGQERAVEQERETSSASDRNAEAFTQTETATADSDNGEAPPIETTEPADGTGDRSAEEEDAT